jgi:hypothetical protein
VYKLIKLECSGGDVGGGGGREERGRSVTEYSLLKKFIFLSQYRCLAVILAVGHQWSANDRRGMKMGKN